MSNHLIDLIETLLKEPAAPSWHEDARRDLGIPEECAHEPLLCLSLERAGTELRATPLAFVVDRSHLGNTVTAVSEFLREAMHPGLGNSDVIALLDFMPPIDDFGSAQGLSRRWVLDRFNYGLLLPEINAYLRTLVRGL
jgi:hypothetical protein